MKRASKIRLVLAALLFAASIAGLLLWWTSPAPIAPMAAKPLVAPAATLAAGARVVALGDCMVCHTARDGPAYAGGLGLKTPFGTIYTTNITPDPETGIGRWSLAAFTRAMRHGVSRDGHLLYPAFPYIHYTGMSDQDIALAYHFLMSRTAIKVQQPENDLPLPLKIRPMLAFWNALYLRPGAGAVVADTSVERGRYLVDTLGHCASCHSGLNLIGGERFPPFRGGHIDGWDAPALTALGSGANPWTEAQLVDYLRGGLALDHGAAKGPMRPVTERLASAPRDDVAAISRYIMSIQAPAASTQGARLFAAACASCHAASAPMMALGARPGLARSSAVLGPHAGNFVQTVLVGIPLEQGSAVYMPPFADTFTDQQIAALAQYVRTSASQPAWPDVAKASAKQRKELQP